MVLSSRAASGEPAESVTSFLKRFPAQSARALRQMIMTAIMAMTIAVMTTPAGSDFFTGFCGVVPPVLTGSVVSFSTGSVSSGMVVSAPVLVEAVGGT